MVAYGKINTRLSPGRLAVPPRTRSASGWADMLSSEADKYTPAERGSETERGVYNVFLHMRVPYARA